MFFPLQFPAFVKKFSKGVSFTSAWLTIVSANVGEAVSVCVEIIANTSVAKMCIAGGRIVLLSRLQWKYPCRYAVRMAQCEEDTP
jgi:hypothetical protein